MLELRLERGLDTVTFEKNNFNWEFNSVISFPLNILATNFDVGLILRTCVVILRAAKTSCAWMNLH